MEEKFKELAIASADLLYTLSDLAIEESDINMCTPNDREAHKNSTCLSCHFESICKARELAARLREEASK